MTLGGVNMAENREDEQTAHRGPTEPPPLPPLAEFEFVLRRPQPDRFGPPSELSNAGFPAPTSLRSLGRSSFSDDSRSSVFRYPISLASHVTAYSSSDRDKVINIGIDLGTTYSGVSWIISNDSATFDIHTVQCWPGKHSVKVPTEICYGDDGEITWGYSIPPDVARLQLLKLFLLDDDSLPLQGRSSKQLESAKKLLRKVFRSPIDVVADYLRQIWKCTMDDIRRHIGFSIDGMPFRVVLTMPANWPKASSDRMKKVAQQAGILDHRLGGLETRLELVGEPEAAALAAFHEGFTQGLIADGDIAVGDILTICDAGGGTVDIVSYEVERTSPTVYLSECVIGDMALCGSIFLDEGFLAYMEEMMGKDELAKLPRSVLQKLMKTWETDIKYEYERGSSELVVELPHQIAKVFTSRSSILKRRKGREKLSGNAMRFAPEEIEGIFYPVLYDILVLLNQHLSATMRKKRKKPKAIALVGGLGSNKFLNQTLMAEFSTGDIAIIQPGDLMAWSSVCRGAAIKGLTFDNEDDQAPPVVTSYISKAHYGIVYKIAFDETKHLEEDRHFDAIRGMDFAWNQMQWYTAKGDDVSKGSPVSLEWERVFPESPPQLDFTLILYECEDDVPPTRMTDKVKKCSTITIPMKWSSLVADENASGQRYRRVQFELRMSMLGMGKLDFATYVDGSLVSRQGVGVKLEDR